MKPAWFCGYIRSYRLSKFGSGTLRPRIAGAKKYLSLIVAVGAGTGKVVAAIAGVPMTLNYSSSVRCVLDR